MTISSESSSTLISDAGFTTTGASLSGCTTTIRSHTLLDAAPSDIVDGTYSVSEKSESGVIAYPPVIASMLYPSPSTITRDNSDSSLSTSE